MKLEKPTYKELAQRVKALEREAVKRREAEEALRKSEERYRRLYEKIPVMLHSIDPQGRLVSVSNHWLAVMGYEADEVIGEKSTVFLTDASRKYAREVVLPEFFQTGYCKEIPYQFVKKNGDIIDVLLSAISDRDHSGMTTRSLAVSIDVTDRKRAEEALLERESRYRNLYENAQIGLFRTRLTDGLFLEANQRLVEMFGFDNQDELILRRCATDYYADPETRSHMMAELKEKGHVRNYEACFVKRDGTHWWARFSGTLYAATGYFEGVASDITENKVAETEKAMLEAQYRQAQKVEAIGRLAGGVAHDLNNLLTPILGYGEMLVPDFNPDDRRRRYVEQIVQAGYRCRDLVRQLLAFGRKQTLAYKPIDLNETIKEFQRLLRRTIREDITLRFLPAPDIETIKADIGQIEQVIMNLSVNAQDAMANGGDLTLETAMVEIDKGYAAVHPGTEPGRYVMLAVSDTGCGMDEEAQSHIFEPFFSTKGEAGTGLGLSTVYGIIKQHGGNIWAYSEPGQGTTIKVYLPVAKAACIEKKTPGESTGNLRGSETILLVEDNEQVRDFTHALLTEHGYTVLVAETGAKALDLIAAQTSPVQLLLADVVMPGMNGKELFTRAVDRQPDLKVLYMSGYTNNVIAHHGVLDEGVQFIQKPFTTHALAVKVREVFDQVKRI